jgi:hypothetical protein
MFRTAERCEVRLQSRDFRTIDELAVRQNAGDRVVDVLAETAALLDDVNERD